MKLQKSMLILLIISILALTSCQSFSDNETAQTDTSLSGISQPDKQPESSTIDSYPYQGDVTCELMPIDWTFLETDVPTLISELEASDFSAVYVDADKVLRVASANDIQISYDAGISWEKLNTEEVSADIFSEWLWQNDPIPGYSIEDLQERLSKDAEVKHVVFDNKQEMYFVIDESGVQIELVQPEKIESVLIDGVRLMFTSTSTTYRLSDNLINVFTDILDDIAVTKKAEASSEWNGVVEHLTENGAHFYEL